mgnify:CR=1 FL=1
MIKFRAWDKVFKEMVQVNALVLDEQVVKVTYKNGNVAKEDMKEYELMQSTGLFDRNNKEIFEGDIITNGKDVMCMKRHNTLGFYVEQKGKVEFIADSAVLEEFEEDAKEIADSLEIIGNIYENKDILEAER